MTGRLTKGMYGREFGRTETSDLFGLQTGQMHCVNKITHNSGWYNQAGDKLGWGDLSSEDFTKVRDGLEEGEMFIVLSESASFWNFVTKVGMIGSMSVTKPDVDAPGTDYVAEHARFIITKGQLYFVSRDTNGERTTNLYGLEFRVLTMDQAKQLIKS